MKPNDDFRESLWELLMAFALAIMFIIVMCASAIFVE